MDDPEDADDEPEEDSAMDEPEEEVVLKRPAGKGDPRAAMVKPTRPRAEAAKATSNRDGYKDSNVDDVEELQQQIDNAPNEFHESADMWDLQSAMESLVAVKISRAQVILRMGAMSFVFLFFPRFQKSKKKT